MNKGLKITLIVIVVILIIVLIWLGIKGIKPDAEETNSANIINGIETDTGNEVDTNIINTNNKREILTMIKSDILDFCSEITLLELEFLSENIYDSSDNRNRRQSGLPYIYYNVKTRFVPMPSTARPLTQTVCSRKRLHPQFLSKFLFTQKQDPA